jgi:hypothetical protein
MLGCSKAATLTLPGDVALGLQNVPISVGELAKERHSSPQPLTPAVKPQSMMATILAHSLGVVQSICRYVI